MFYKDPVCGKKVNRNKVHVKIRYEEEDYYLCCPLCQATFEKNPQKYIGKTKQVMSKL